MKKIKFLAVGCACIISLAVAVGCQSGYNPAGNTASNSGSVLENIAVNDETLAMLSVEQILETASEQELRFDANQKTEWQKILTPFYNNQIQYGEGFFLQKNAEGYIDDIKLNFPVKKILEIRSSNLQIKYEEGTDYVLNQDGTISIPDGSSMQAFRQKDMLVDSGTYRYQDGTKPVMGGPTYQAEIYEKQYVCTYIRTDGYDGNRANTQKEKFNNLFTKIESCEDINILTIGDSITWGAGAEKYVDEFGTEKTHFKTWAEMVGEGIAHYSSQSNTISLDKQRMVYVHNAAVPGIDSYGYMQLIDNNMDDGSLANIKASAIEQRKVYEAYKASADLVIIGLGANDSGGWCGGGNGTSAQDYASQIQYILNSVREANPNCAVLLVSCMELNTKLVDIATGVKFCAGDLAQYEKELSNIAKNSEEVGVANVYSVGQSLLANKKIEDLLADNYNHPSDYMSRIYAQVVLSSLLDL